MKRLTGVLMLTSLPSLLLAGCAPAPPDHIVDEATGTEKIKVEFTGGHDTNPVDHGRPVVLIAAALGVPSEVFRDAFSRVKPAPAGTSPSHDRVHENKRVLMEALGPHGITNERLDEVSNYYRYVRSRGELWPTEPALVYALIEDGKIVGFEIINGGSGYSSPPVAVVPGWETQPLQVELAYGDTFETNGSVQSITSEEVN
ncbi:hypothetical protein [Calycomorphotria hydatis]|uniref:Lipoprotein n=1 Tax=Calycomorphotria hydatis TaxID=2528027 RepID=A0A517TBK8_9PLAN|nr:hypothetical protein [Calycomorphotria hydatis]QDT65753.1 hypothetical protein V22_30140 [Calycomorphotria hydatis]